MSIKDIPVQYLTRLRDFIFGELNFYSEKKMKRSLIVDVFREYRVEPSYFKKFILIIISDNYYKLFEYAFYKELLRNHPYGDYKTILTIYDIVFKGVRSYSSIKSAVEFYRGKPTEIILKTTLTEWFDLIRDRCIGKRAIDKVKLTIECSECGYSFERQLGQIRSTRFRGCYKCNLERTKFKAFSFDDAISYAKQIHAELMSFKNLNLSMTNIEFDEILVEIKNSHKKALRDITAFLTLNLKCNNGHILEYGIRSIRRYLLLGKIIDIQEICSECIETLKKITDGIKSVFFGFASTRDAYFRHINSVWHLDFQIGNDYKDKLSKIHEKEVLRLLDDNERHGGQVSEYPIHRSYNEIETISRFSDNLKIGNKKSRKDKLRIHVKTVIYGIYTPENFAPQRSLSLEEQMVKDLLDYLDPKRYDKKDLRFGHGEVPHDIFGRSIFKEKSYVLGTEIEVCFTDSKGSLHFGHIDLLILLDNILYVVDLKPGCNLLTSVQWIKSIPQVGSYGLTLMKVYNAQNVKCITCNQGAAIVYDPIKALNVITPFTSGYVPWLSLL